MLSSLSKEPGDASLLYLDDPRGPSCIQLCLWYIRALPDNDDIGIVQVRANLTGSSARQIGHELELESAVLDNLP